MGRSEGHHRGLSKAAYGEILMAAVTQATLALAVIRGLMLDDNATDDHSRIDAAFAIFDGL